MPLLAILLGVAGLIPFIVCGLGAVSVDPVLANRMLVALIGYGAVILSFLGGVHWGFALASPAIPPPLGTETPGIRRFLTAGQARLVLGVVPALIVLIAGFIATVVVEQQAARRMLLQPAGYIWLRWGLTVVVVAMLVTVLTLRLLGRQIY